MKLRKGWLLHSSSENIEGGWAFTFKLKGVYIPAEIEEGKEFTLNKKWNWERQGVYDQTVKLRKAGRLHSSSEIKGVYIQAVKYGGRVSVYIQTVKCRGRESVYIQTLKLRAFSFKKRNNERGWAFTCKQWNGKREGVYFQTMKLREEWRLY